MPTPFMHLQVAEQIKHQVTREGNGRLLTLLQTNWPAFYWGSVAPDYQSTAQGISRDSTHFHTVPPAPDEEAYRNMLQAHPSLTNLQTLPADKAMFIAAYSAHLMLDLIWLREVVYPFFFQPEGIGSREERILLHFVLLTYLDMKAYQTLPPTAHDTLAQATRPHEDWAPFANPDDLVRWRNMLLPQLKEEGTLRTVEVYAGRLNMTPEAFAANLQDETWMTENLFKHVPVLEVSEIIATAVPKSITLLQKYFSGQIP